MVRPMRSSCVDSVRVALSRCKLRACGLVDVDVWLRKVWALLFDSLAACHKTSDGTAVRCLADVDRQQLRIVKDRERRSAAAAGVRRGGGLVAELWLV
jgi:hypothetical protein